MTNRTIYLVRHAQTDVRDEFPDRLGFGLTALGERQARLTGERLSALPVRIVHHSSLRRAAETARILAERLPGVPLCHSRLLWECIPRLPVWGRELFNDISPEILRRGQRQAELAFAKFFYPAPGFRQVTRQDPGCEVIVCHGNLLRYFILRALGAPPDLWTNTDTYNCCISEVTVGEDGRLVMLAHNDIGHIPLGMRTF
jgi:serine/threonine-protein phosphatase PGAM5